MTDRPLSSEYFRDHAQALGFPSDMGAAKKIYEFNLRAAHQSVVDGSHLSGIMGALNRLRSQYAGGRPELLFYTPGEPTEEIELKIHKKPFDSTLNKIYRKNVLFNKKYPRDPKEGSLTFKNLYQEVDDLLRCRIVCKYMDGPKYVCEGLASYCRDNDIKCNHRELSTWAGYYAWHFYACLPVEIKPESTVETCLMHLEIQLTTQLAEVITHLTHGLYEERRVSRSAFSDDEWKWEADSQRFRSAYLGHGLHLLEGIIKSFKDEVIGIKPVVATLAEEVNVTTEDFSVAMDQEPTQKA